MWTTKQIAEALGPQLTEELLRNLGYALVCEGCGRKVAAQFLWKNATSIINEGIAKLEAGAKHAVCFLPRRGEGTIHGIS